MGWYPKVTFEKLVNEMVNEDLRLANNENVINNN